MASAPSASALSAVLRCRGNLWTRNPPTKRPASASYSLGLAGGALRDSSAARTGQKQTSAAWKVSPHGEARGSGRGAAVECRWERVGDEAPGDGEKRKSDKLFSPKLSQSPGSARPAAPRAENTVARGLASVLLGRDACTKIIHLLRCESRAALVRDVVSVQDVSKLPPGVLKVCVTSTCLVGVWREDQTFVSPGWSTLRSACTSLSSVVSSLIFLKLLRLQDKPREPQTNGEMQTSSQDNVSSGREMTQDRPD